MGWRTTAYRAVRPLLFGADPELVHHFALRVLGSEPGRMLAPVASGLREMRQARRMAEARPYLPVGFVVGVNIGRNRDGDVGDYPAAARAVADAADYLAINVSSPNTPGLRQLQEPDQVLRILDGVASAAPNRPVLVKLSPDLSDDERATLLDRLTGSPAAGVIVSNTTVTRPSLRLRRLALEAGGLSGRPLLPMTLRALEQAAGHRVTVIASGGIRSGADAGQSRPEPISCSSGPE